jgi:hypothetical protein
MKTAGEIRQAMIDFQSGRFGEIGREEPPKAGQSAFHSL